MILTLSPLPNKPFTPSFSIISFRALGYEIACSLVYLVVFKTLNELDILSDITEAVKPINAYLINFLYFSSY